MALYPRQILIFDERSTRPHQIAVPGAGPARRGGLRPLSLAGASRATVCSDPRLGQCLLTGRLGGWGVVGLGGKRTFDAWLPNDLDGQVAADQSALFNVLTHFLVEISPTWRTLRFMPNRFRNCLSNMLGLYSRHAFPNLMSTGAVDTDTDQRRSCSA